MIIPAGTKNVSSYIKTELHDRVRIAGIKRGGLAMPAILEEALTSWVEREERASTPKKGSKTA
jgi:hypothetical protein